MGRVDILGPERRRNWSEDQKRAIVAAAFAPGAVLSEVARTADVDSGLIYRWRRKFRDACPGFAELVVTGEAPSLVSAKSAIEVVLPSGARVHIPMSSRPELASAVLRALVRS